MNPLTNGIDAGSFTASLMAISAPAESSSISINISQISDIQEINTGVESFSALLGTLGDLLPDTAPAQLETLVGDGNNLPQTAAGTAETGTDAALPLPHAALLSVARQVEQAPAKPLGAQPGPLLQPQPILPVVATPGAVPNPSAVDGPVPPQPLAAGTAPLATALVGELAGLPKAVSGQPADVDAGALAARLTSGDTQAGGQPGGAALLRVVEGVQSLRVAAPLALETPVGTRGWEQGVAERVLWMVGSSVQSASLRLNPAHLGPIEIQVSVQQEQASVTFTAQHAPVREALEMSIPRLREMFTENNLQLANVDVGQRGQGEQQGGGSARGSGEQSAHADGGRKQAQPGQDELENGPANRLASDCLLDDYA